MSDDLPIRLRAADRERERDQELRDVGAGGGSLGVSDGALEVEVDDVTRIRIGLLDDGQIGVQFYDEDGNAQRTITGVLG